MKKKIIMHLFSHGSNTYLFVVITRQCLWSSIFYLRGKNVQILLFAHAAVQSNNEELKPMSTEQNALSQPFYMNLNFFFRSAKTRTATLFFLPLTPSVKRVSAATERAVRGRREEKEREGNRQSGLAEGGIQRDTVTVCPRTAFAHSFWVPES